MFGSTADFVAPGGAGDVADAGRQRRKNWIELLNRRRLSSNHHAIASLQAPHAAARPDVHIVNLLRCEFLRTANVIDVVGITSVYQNVPGFKVRCECVDHVVDYSGRDHEPNRARFAQLTDKIFQGGGGNCIFFRQFFNRLWRPVEYHALVASSEKPPHHVGSHPSKTDHSDLHSDSFFKGEARGVGRSQTIVLRVPAFSVITDHLLTVRFQLFPCWACHVFAPFGFCVSTPASHPTGGILQ